MSRQLLLALAFLPLLCHAVPVELGNDHYKATVSPDGTCRVELSGGPTFRVSLAQRWTKFQNAASMHLVEGDGPASGADGSVVVAFKYFWNDYAVEERLVFRQDGFGVEYACSPSVEKDVEGLSILIGHDIKNAKDYELAALRYFYDQPGALEFDLPLDGPSRRLSQLSLRRKGGLTADFSGLGDTWLWVGRGMFGTTDCAPDWSKKKYRSGETYRTGFDCRLSRSNGKVLPPSVLNQK